MMAYITPGSPGSPGTWYIKPDGSAEEIRSRAYYDRLTASGATFVTATSESDAKAKASSASTAPYAPSAPNAPQPNAGTTTTAPVTGGMSKLQDVNITGTTKSNDFPANWQNMTVTQLWDQYSPQALSQLPLTALIGGTNGYKGFPNELLQQVIDANPAILADIPADRLVGTGAWQGSGFPSDAIANFVNNLEQRGDYTQNQKVQAQASNLRSAIPSTAPNLKPPEQNAAQRPTTAPVQNTDGTPPSTAPTTQPVPMSFSGSGMGIPVLDEQALQQRLGGLSSQAGALDLFRAYTGTQVTGGTTAPVQGGAFPDFETWRQANPGATYDQYFAARQAAGGGSGGISTLQGDPPPNYPSDQQWIPNQLYEPDPDKRIEPIQGVEYVQNPYYKAPASPPTYAPRPPLEAEQTAQQIAASQAQIEIAKQNLELAKQQNDFEQVKYWQDRADQLTTQQQQLAYNNDKLGIDAQLGYADSARQDIATNLAGAGVTGYLNGAPTLERELAVGTAARDNLETLAALGNSAAQIQLADLQRQEGARQFDANLGLQQQEFDFQRRQSPASAYEQAFAGRSLGTPGGSSVPVQNTMSSMPVQTQSLSSLPVQTQSSAPIAPLTAREAFVDNPNVTTAVRQAAVRPGADQVALPNVALLQNLLPSEMAQYRAGLSASGMNPDDAIEQGRRLTATTAPVLATTTVRRRSSAPVSVY